MDLTAIDLATDEQKKQGVVEWAEAFKADSWEEVQEIDNTGVKEAAKTMQLIMSNPTERDLVRARRDAQFDHRTQINAARRDAHLEDARRMKLDGLSPALISKYTGLSASEVAAL